jgi:N-acetylmuramoyl-L-alanine amidase
MQHIRFVRLGTIAALVIALALVSVAPASATDGDATPVQETLRQLGFYRGPINGEYDQAIGDAILAFHKTVGTRRTRDWVDADWENARALTSVGYEIPDRPDEPNRIEIDLYRQIMFLIERGSVVAVFPIVSGKGDTYQRLGHATAGLHTPVGDFQLLRHVDGWRTAELGRIYRPWYFVGGYAIHGGKVAHAQPASHGCVRVPMADMDWLESHLELGMPVHVWVGEGAVGVSTYRLEHLAAGMLYDIM